MQIWDTLIVGAGPAGAAAAFDLARAGRSVLLLDRSTFPRPKACAAGLTIKTLRALRYSVAPVTHRTVHTIRLEGPGAPATNVTTRDPICVTAVREEFDLFCLEQTLAAGARFQQIGPILSLTQTDPNHPDGLVTLRTADGLFHARYLLGADGANSQVRKLLHRASLDTPSAATLAALPPEPTQHPAEPSPTPATEPPWLTRGFALETHLPLPLDGHVPDLLFDFSISNGYAWIFPKRDHLNVGLGFFSTTPGPLARAALSAYIARHPVLAAAAPGASSASPHGTLPPAAQAPLKVVGQYLAFGLPDYLPSGRILLTGDAAGTLDPLTAEGIYPAITSGQAAAEAIHYALTSGTPAAPHYLALTDALRDQLRFSARAARRFYQDPAIGLRALRLPLMRQAIVRTYALGIARPTVLSRVAQFALKLQRAS